VRNNSVVIPLLNQFRTRLPSTGRSFFNLQVSDELKVSLLWLLGALGSKSQKISL
ncbi:unnamed protein product, partial [Acidithrix sp. C25]